MPKEDRIRRLVPLYEQGRVFRPYRCIFVDYEGRAHDLTREFIDQEYLAFPVSHHDDMLDCEARIVDPDLGARFPDTSAVQQGLHQAVTDYDVLSGVTKPGRAQTSYNLFGG